MLEKNYTNPNDKGRFGFSASGKYNAPYKLEHVVVAVMAAAGIVALVFIVLVVAGIIRGNPSGFYLGLMLMSLAGGVVAIVIGIAVFITAVIIIKFIMQGFSCSYLADEEKFTLNVGGTAHTIYYKEVQGVHFEPRMSLFHKTVRGYNVTIKINGINEEYGIVSDNYISEKTTPFYIIKERVEALRVSEEREREFGTAGSGIIGGSVGGAPRVKRDEAQEAIARMESILGKDAEMPGISAANASVSEMPEISRHVSPTVNGYADDMPAVGADGKVIQSAPTYFGTNGRELDVYDVVAQGSFRVAVRKRTAVVMGVVGIAVYAALFYLVTRIPNALDMVTGAVLHLTIGQIGMIILAPFYAGTIIAFLRNGREYHYRANGREFVVTSKGIPDEHFFYKDVQSVNYKKMVFLWFIKGYKVEILTRHGITEYNYVFPGFGRLQPTRNLPFEAIRERIEHK